MYFIGVALGILFLAVISTPISVRLKVPLEIFLFIGSCFISFLPGLPTVDIDPRVFFEIFLPPILFSAAYFTSWRDFKFNLRPISLLAFGLVIFTAVSVAFVIKLLVPDFTWAQGLLLGAIVSPSDATSATAIIRKLGAPRRFIAVLEGESLVNDATALILFSFSLAAVMNNNIVVEHIAWVFILVVAGGGATGLLLAMLALMIIKQLEDTRAETTLTFVLAFSSYLIAHKLGFSGVISTVVAGIYFGIHLPNLARAGTKLNANASWGTLMFIINGFVFALIGLELPAILHGIEAIPVSHLAGYGFIISFLVIGIRILWIFPNAYVPRFIFPSIIKRDPVPSNSYLFLLGWTGMRGVVSLAAVLSIPHVLPDGSPFPHLLLIKFLVYSVIVVTLLLPSLTLPMLFRYFNVHESINRHEEETRARIKSLSAVPKLLTEYAEEDEICEKVLIEFQDKVKREMDDLQNHLDNDDFLSLNDEYHAAKKMKLAAIQFERKTLVEMREQGEVHDEVFHSLVEELDMEEMRTRKILKL